MFNSHQKLESAKQVRKYLDKRVDAVKLIFFKLSADYFSTIYDLPEFIKNLGTVVVNEMFSCHSDSSLLDLAENKIQIEEAIKFIRHSHPNLCQAFSDALIISMESHTLENGNPPSDLESTLKNASERGFFDVSKGSPRTVNFLKTTHELIEKYSL